MFTHSWLVSDWDSRDPHNDLSDIDTGKYLQALHEVPQSVRQLIEDADCHVEVDLIGNNWRVVKIIKKREPEYLKGSETHFVRDEDGRKISVSEDEVDRMCGIVHDPEDVYNRDDVEFVGLESEYHVPRDVWDVVFDATEAVREARRLIEEYQAAGWKLHQSQIDQLVDKLTYSANWYPYSRDKRIKSKRGKEIARAIARGVSRQRLAAMLSDPQRDNRYEVANNLRAQAMAMPLGRQRAALMKRSVELKEAADQAAKRRAPFSFVQGLCKQEKDQLWSLWRQHQLSTTGKCELTKWQVDAMVRAKRLRAQ